MSTGTEMKDEAAMSGRGGWRSPSLASILFALLNLGCFALGLVSGFNSFGIGTLAVLVAGVPMAVFARSRRAKNIGISLALGAVAFWVLVIGFSGRG